jgi:hypothetical protein
MKNRISLLAIEEQRLRNKIDKTRTRYEQIIKSKSDNEERFLNKMRKKQEENERILRQKDHNNKVREMHKFTLDHNSNQILKRKH